MEERRRTQNLIIALGRGKTSVKEEAYTFKSWTKGIEKEEKFRFTGEFRNRWTQRS